MRSLCVPQAVPPPQRRRAHDPHSNGVRLRQRRTADEEAGEAAQTLSQLGLTTTDDDEVVLGLGGLGCHRPEGARGGDAEGVGGRERAGGERRPDDLGGRQEQGEMG